MAGRLCSIVLLAATCASSGCVPQVLHGPRVEPGPRFALSGVVHGSLQGRDRWALPTVYAGYSHGWVGDAADPALLVGVQVPLVLLGAVWSEDRDEVLSATFIDAYVQPRRDDAGRLEYGAGALISRSMVVPYLQVGRSGDGSTYMTQAFAFYHGEGNPVVVWLPSLSFRSQDAAGRFTADMHVGGGLAGWGDWSARDGRIEGTWFLGAGVVVGWQRGRRE